MSLSITPDALIRLENLRQERKFAGERFYPGAPTEEIRSTCELRVNEFLSDVVSLLQNGTERENIFAKVRVLIEIFRHDDTEEREKVGDYINRSMHIIGLDDWTEHV